MDRVKIQEQREVWLRASAALKAREAEQAHAVRKHADEVERATKRVAEEREKLDAMIADTQAQLEKLGAVPEEAEVAAAGSTIGEAVPELPTGAIPEAINTCRHTGDLMRTESDRLHCLVCNAEVAWDKDARAYIAVPVAAASPVNF